MQPELPRFQRGRRKLHRAAKFATLVIGITAAAAILSPNSKRKPSTRCLGCKKKTTMHAIVGGVSNSASSRRSGRSLLYANETANASTTTTPSATNASCADELESLGFDWSELEELDIKEEEIFAACTFDVVAEFRDIDVETGNISLPWEECDFERDHLPVLFVVVYVLAIIILFVGKGTLLIKNYFMILLFFLQAWPSCATISSCRRSRRFQSGSICPRTSPGRRSWRPDRLHRSSSRRLRRSAWQATSASEQ